MGDERFEDNQKVIKNKRIGFSLRIKADLMSTAADTSKYTITRFGCLSKFDLRPGIILLSLDNFVKGRYLDESGSCSPTADGFSDSKVIEDFFGNCFNKVL